MGQIFFTADEHYGHANILRLCHRPFSTVEEQTEVLIKNFNEKVGHDDHTWHLGDILWRTLDIEYARWILSRLNGTHSLILGNHDELVRSSILLKTFFQQIEDLIDIPVPQIKKQRLVLCHYAMRVWGGSHKGAWHLYGHSHGTLPGQGLSFDVGVDNCRFAPMSMNEVKKEMERRAG